MSHTRSRVYGQGQTWMEPFIIECIHFFCVLEITEAWKWKVQKLIFEVCFYWKIYYLISCLIIDQTMPSSQFIRFIIRRNLSCNLSKIPKGRVWRKFLIFLAPLFQGLYYLITSDFSKRMSEYIYSVNILHFSPHTIFLLSLLIHFFFVAPKKLFSSSSSFRDSKRTRVDRFPFLLCFFTFPFPYFCWHRHIQTLRKFSNLILSHKARTEGNRNFFELSLIFFFSFFQPPKNKWEMLFGCVGVFLYAHAQLHEWRNCVVESESFRAREWNYGKWGYQKYKACGLESDLELPKEK